MRQGTREIRGRVPRAAAAAIVVVLAGCTAPKEADIPITAEAAARPVPELGETARFTAAIAEATSATERLGMERADLEARAAGLRDRAAALDAPVLDEAERDRLIAARDSPPVAEE